MSRENEDDDEEVSDLLENAGELGTIPGREQHHVFDSDDKEAKYLSEFILPQLQQTIFQLDGKIMNILMFEGPDSEEFSLAKSERNFKQEQLKALKRRLKLLLPPDEPGPVFKKPRRDDDPDDGMSKPNLLAPIEQSDSFNYKMLF